MTTILLGVCIGQAILLGSIIAWQYTNLRNLRRLASERQIRMEEAQAWADEYERERDAMAAECDRLGEQCSTLRALYTRQVRESLTGNYWIIARNAEWRRHD